MVTPVCNGLVCEAEPAGRIGNGKRRMDATRMRVHYNLRYTAELYRKDEKSWGQLPVLTIAITVYNQWLISTSL